MKTQAVPLRTNASLRDTSVTPRKQKTRRKDMKLLCAVRAHQREKCDSKNLTLPTKWSRPKLLIGNIYKKIIRNIYPGGSEGKSSACNVGDSGSIPGSGRSPGGGNGHPLQHSFLENPMDGGAWWTTVHRVTKSQTQLSDFTSLHKCKEKHLRNWILAISLIGVVNRKVKAINK